MWNGHRCQIGIRAPTLSLVKLVRALLGLNWGWGHSGASFFSLHVKNLPATSSYIQEPGLPGRTSPGDKEQGNAAKGPSEEKWNVSLPISWPGYKNKKEKKKGGEWYPYLYHLMWAGFFHLIAEPGWDHWRTKAIYHRGKQSWEQDQYMWLWSFCRTHRHLAREAMPRICPKEGHLFLTCIRSPDGLLLALVSNLQE